MVKFVGHDASGLPVKRKQVHQACLPCRKRKKRCHHVEGSNPATPLTVTDQNPESQDVPATARSTRRRRTNSDPDRDTSDAAAQLLRFFHHASDKASVGSPDNDGTQRQQSRPMSPAPPPFLGDLNPEGILVEATMAPATATKTSQAEPPDHQVIGFLPPASPQQRARTSSAQDRRATATGSPKLVEETPGPFFSVPREDGSRFTIHVRDTAKFAALAQTLVNRGLAEKVMPSETEWRIMRDLYLAKIHPIFPIYEESTLVNLPEKSDLRELIQASVCLAAATDLDTSAHLTFKSPAEAARKSQTTVSYDEYSREVADFINRRLVELQEGHQISLTYQIQVMALTCFYWQPAGRTERFEPLTLYAKLVSLVHTHGVHLGLLSRAQADGSPEGRGSRLFKCLFALDRLIAAISARPVMFNNIDLIQIPRPDASDPPIFRLFLTLILLLDQVFEMYRPRPNLNFIDIPVYERMVIEAGAQSEQDSLLATLEVLYHAIGVLSVRMPRHRFRTAPECDTDHGPRTQHLPPSSLNARRSHSADRILDVIKDYKLSPVAFIPYAITLSLSVAYRKWRFSQLPMFRARGGADFKRVLPVVQQLGAIWSCARINGQLGQAVVLKLDRNEILNRKRAKRVTGAARTKRGQGGVLPNNQEASAEASNTSNRVDGENNTRSARATTAPPSHNITTTAPPNAPPDSTVGSAQTAEVKSARNGNPQGHAISTQHPLPPSTAPPVTERPQPQSLPLIWTNTWTADDTINNNNNLPTNLPWLATAPAKDTSSHPNPTQQLDAIPPGHTYTHPDDVIPLPGDLSTQQSTAFDTSPLAGLSDGNVEDFLVDDDALFRSWDPRFAQSVDFSFSSILDPGNPFAWPEYCDYTS